MTMAAEVAYAATSAKLQEQVGSGSMRPAKLFIGGITRNTTTKQLRDHFSAYGRVLDCVAMRQPDGRPRGFGYVTLDSSAAADRCLAVPQIVDGRVVDMKRAVPEGDVCEMPTTRLHTPGSRPAPAPGLPQAQFGSWAELAPLSSPLNAYGFPMSPLSTMSPLGAVGHIMGDAACRWPWGLEDFSQARPDCLDLLSRGRSGLLSTSPQATPTASMFPWSLPTTPTASQAGALSASAPEFVPFESKKPEKAAKRSILGDISNTIGAKQDSKEALVASKKATSPASQPCPGNENIENAESVPPAPNRTMKPLSQSRPFGLRQESLLIFVEPEFDASAPEEAQVPTPEETTPEAKEQPETSEPETLKVEHRQEPAELATLQVQDEGQLCATCPTEDHSLPSLGSADHAAGTCKRCNFFPKGRCQNGKSCTFCHLPHEKRKPSRQEKRERRAAWLAQQEAGHVGEMPEEFQDDDEEDDDDENDDVNQIMAYSVLPGLPPLRATKLPAPLTLPGTGYPLMSSYTCGYPMPPPGLCLGPHMGLEGWQPEDEVSPHRRRAPAPLLMTAPPLLATVPMAPCTPHSVAASPTAAVVKEMFLAASSPAAASLGQSRAGYCMEAAAHVAVVAQKPAMVTMATQTENEDCSEEVTTANASGEDDSTTRQGAHTWTKAELLKFRTAVVQCGNGGVAPLRAMAMAKAEAN